jgi:restriction system protein
MAGKVARVASLDPKQRRGERLQTVLRILSENPDGVRAKDVLSEVEKRLTLTAYEKGDFEKTGLRRFEKLVRFGTVNAVKAGWLVKDKGTWTVTDDGLVALKKYPDPEEFYTAAEAGYQAWAKLQPAKEKARPGPAPPPDASTDESAASVTVEEAEETAFEEITRHLATMNPYDTQRLVAGLLRGMGYHVPWVAPPGKDKGVDLVAFRDPLGTEDPRIKVQVKREQGKTDVRGLRAFMSVLNPGDVGVFVTLGGFTSDAESEARNSETRRVTLIDQSDLFDLWVEHYERIPTDDRRLLPLKPVYFLALGTTAVEEE